MIRRTPLIQFRLEGHEVWLKLENLQRTGSFKLRGAAQKLSKLSERERRGKVVAASAGNHGAGLAYAGRQLGVAVTVFVPTRTPEVKKRRIAELGAEIVCEGATYDEAEALARARAASLGVPFVSPFDDDDVMAGNGGTLADEIMDQAPDVARIVVPVGGGGLIAGMALAVAGRGIELVGVQPERNCAMHESFRTGIAQTSYVGQYTVAEGCEGAVGSRCFDIARANDVSIVLVSESQIERAVATLYRDAGTVSECSGAVAAAGVLAGVVPTGGRTVVVVTGGNIEPDQLDELLQRRPGKA